jgi:glycolate oxidase
MKETYNLKDYEEDIYRCIRCGFCRAVCPVLQEEDMNEIVGPRSFVLTAKGIVTNNLKPSESMAEKIYECMECGACNVKCPPGVKIEQIIRAARNRLIESGVDAPKHVQLLIDSIVDDGRLHTQSKDKSNQNILSDLPIEEKADVLYYVGCAAHQLEPNQVNAMIQILQKAHVDFTVLEKEECCGLPLLNYGLTGLFDDRVDKNMKMFKRAHASTIVTTCPGCYRAFSELYPKNSLKMQHSSQFIKELIENRKIGISKSVQKKITYHDPCDLGRHSGIFDPPRDIIRLIPNVEFVEIKRNRIEAQCCGAGAGFALAYPEISRRICSKRLEKDINPTGAEILVTSCPNCTHQFKETIQSIGDSVLKSANVLDITELVAKTI